MGAIKAGAGYRNAVMEVIDEMFNKMGAAAANIGLANAMVQLGLGKEGFQQGFLFLIFFVPVKVQQVIDTQSVG